MDLEGDSKKTWSDEEDDNLKSLNMNRWRSRIHKRTERQEAEEWIKALIRSVTSANVLSTFVIIVSQFLPIHSKYSVIVRLSNLQYQFSTINFCGNNSWGRRWILVAVSSQEMMNWGLRKVDSNESERTLLES